MNSFQRKKTMKNKSNEEFENKKLNSILLKLDEDMHKEFEKSKKDLFNKIESVLLKNQKTTNESKDKKIKIPKIFNMDMQKFMNCELKEFSDLTSKNGYKKITSSLNYLSKKMPDISNRIDKIKSYLKNLKAGAKQSQIQKEEKIPTQEVCEQPKSENTSKSLEDRLPTSEDE